MLQVINFLFNTNITTGQLKLLTYIIGGSLIVFLIYFVLWKRLSYYANLMNRLVLQQWSKAEDNLREGGSKTVTNLKMQRLHEEYSEKIQTAYKRREAILKYVPFMKALYKRKLGKDAPVFLTLPK